jgi:hypothetical protein
MTPEEWESGDNPAWMLGHLLEESMPSERKLRLFGVACCRRAWHLLTEPCRQALETAEQFADGQVPAAGRKAARTQAFQAQETPGFYFAMGGKRGETAGALARQAVCQVLAKKPEVYRLHELDVALGWDAWAATSAPSIRGDPRYFNGRTDQAVEQVAEFRRGNARLVLDVSGNPFRPPASLGAPILAYNGGAVKRLAEAIYAARRFEDLPVLADLLEEAGCTDAALLGHLRGPGPHVLGCHGLDAVLGKS